MISILDRVIYGTFLSLLKLFKDSKLKENNMTAVVSRPGVNGATRYMIGNNLVFFHHFDTCQDGHPKYTIAYFFPEDGTMMLAVTVRNPIDAFDRKLGNDIAFDRLLDGIRLPKDSEAQSHFYKVSFDEEAKGLVRMECAHSCKGIVCAKDREEATDMLLDVASRRKFRSVSHEFLQKFISAYFKRMHEVRLANLTYEETSLEESVEMDEESEPQYYRELF